MFLGSTIERDGMQILKHRLRYVVEGKEGV
jgi:hypothetical protein